VSETETVPATAAVTLRDAHAQTISPSDGRMKGPPCARSGGVVVGLQKIPRPSAIPVLSIASYNPLRALIQSLGAGCDNGKSHKSRLMSKLIQSLTASESSRSVLTLRVNRSSEDRAPVAGRPASAEAHRVRGPEGEGNRGDVPIRRSSDLESQAIGVVNIGGFRSLYLPGGSCVPLKLSPRASVHS
jgi:hypothetical protein